MGVVKNIPRELTLLHNLVSNFGFSKLLILEVSFICVRHDGHCIFKVDNYNINDY